MKSTAIAAARTALKAGSHLVDRVVAPAPGIVVLIYHRVGHGSGGEMDLDPGAFRAQLEWLRDTIGVISLDDVVSRVSGSTPVQPAVALTFDDGTDDWHRVIAPILHDVGVPGTFYVATSFIEHQEALPGGGRPATWSGLAELAATGLATFGSHTHHHVLLDRLEPTAIAAELDRSVDLIGERLGVEARHFCYPKALEPSAAADAEVRRRFDSAVLAGTRANTVGADPYRLARSPVQRSDGRRSFEAKAHGGLGTEDRIRVMLNRRRYRGATV